MQEQYQASRPILLHTSFVRLRNQGGQGHASISTSDAGSLDMISCAVGFHTTTQNASPGTRTQPSINTRALRLMMALVTVHSPFT